MIRMVQFDYFHEGRSNHVAFLNTVTDQFYKFNGTHCWDSWSDLFEDVNIEIDDPVLLERLECLSPQWFMDAHP